MYLIAVVIVLLKLKETKDHGPEWKYVAVLEEKDKDSPKLQQFKIKIRSHFKIREFQGIFKIRILNLCARA